MKNLLNKLRQLSNPILAPVAMVYDDAAIEQMSHWHIFSGLPLTLIWLIAIASFAQKEARIHLEKLLDKVELL